MMEEESNDFQKEQLDLRKELIHDLHKQFAENQNKHLEIFIGMVGSFVALFGALGYTYSHWEYNLPSLKNGVDCGEIIKNAATDLSNLPYTTETLFGAIFVVNLLFLLMILLVTNFGWTYRRDQVLNDKIRAEYLHCAEYTKFFEITNYGKNSDKMPDLYEIFFKFGIACQFILYLFTLYVISVIPAAESLSAMAVLLVILLIPIAPFVELVYYYKRYLKQFFIR